MARSTAAKITWGTSFANTLTIAYVDDPVAYPEPRGGSEWAMSPSGVEDAWMVGDDEFLAFVAGWIPTTDTTDPVATGWDGATGWAAFLAWARDKNVFRFFPDADSATYQTAYLAEPMRGPPELEDDGTRRLSILLRSSDGTAFTGY